MRARLTKRTRDDCPAEYQSCFRPVSCSEGIGCESGGPHAQKSETHVKNAENHPADSQRTQIVHAIQSTYQCRIYRPEQRDGQIADDVGNGQSKDLFIQNMYLIMITIYVKHTINRFMQTMRVRGTTQPSTHVYATCCSVWQSCKAPPDMSPDLWWPEYRQKAEKKPSERICKVDCCLNK